jgi:hypothetical protein
MDLLALIVPIGWSIVMINSVDFEGSTLEWMLNNIRLPKGARFDFADRQWQLAILNDKSQSSVLQKPTQIGATTIFLIKMFHFADRHNARALFTEPRIQDLSALVNSRVDEIIRESPYLQNKMKGGVDNIQMKRFDKSWLHFIEMSTPPRSLDADWVCADEVDLSNSEHLEQLYNRLDASKLAFHHSISTPSINDYGINVIYETSTKNEWFVKCSYCNHEQVMSWSSNVIHDKGKTWYACAVCHNTLHADDIRDGRWVITGDKNSDISGYQISQLMTPYITPDKLWAEYNKVSRKTFYNYRLGLPYTPSNAAIDKDIIEANCFTSRHNKENFRTLKDGTYVLGCDQGNTLHVAVGRVEGDAIKIVNLLTIPFELGFNELSNLIRRYNIKKAVVDALPNHHDAHSLSVSWKGRVQIAYFTQTEGLYQADELKVNINKTDAYDRVLQIINDSTLQFYVNDGHITEETTTTIAHLCNMRRDLEVRYTRFGGIASFHVWKATGPDHYADAILYMMIASDMVKSNSGSLSVYDLDDVRQETNLWNLIFEHDEEGTAIVDGAKMPQSIHEESMIREKVEFVPDNPYVLRRQNLFK